MSIVTIFLATTGFLLFGLGSDGLYRRWISRQPGRFSRLRLKLAGWSMLLLAFPLRVISDGWIFGPIAWFGTVMLGAGAAFLAFNYLPVAQSTSAAKQKKG